MRTAFFLLLAAVFQGDERALRFYDRIQFEKVDPQEEEGRRVVELFLKKEHWVGAYLMLEKTFGKFSDDLELKVDFKLESDDQLGRALAQRNRGAISFNLKQLTEGQKKIDEFDRQKKEARARGDKFYFTVPPLKYDRIIYHELTHILQRGYEAPLWFLEGMAQLAGEDMNAICSMSHGKRPVKYIDEALPERNDVYARGHLFWKWLDSLGAAKKAVELSILQRRPWKDAVEEATQTPWSVILITEREWSAKNLDLLK